MMLTTRYASHAELQRIEGSDEAYREALLLFLAALDQVRNPDDPLYSEKGNLMDKTLIYVRLARLERRAGNSAGFEGYMKQAVTTCEALYWKNCQSEHLVIISERLEKIPDEDDRKSRTLEVAAELVAKRFDEISKEQKADPNAQSNYITGAAVPILILGACAFITAGRRRTPRPQPEIDHGTGTGVQHDNTRYQMRPLTNFPRRLTEWRTKILPWVEKDARKRASHPKR